MFILIVAYCDASYFYRRTCVNLPILFCIIYATFCLYGCLDKISSDTYYSVSSLNLHMAENTCETASLRMVPTTVRLEDGLHGKGVDVSASLVIGRG